MSGKILLVDNKKNFLDTMADLIKTRGVEVTTADSAQKAMAQIESNDFDAIVLELMLPGMDGLETLKAIKEKNPDLQVIMLTGHATVEKGIEAIKLGALDIVEKPVSLDKLTKVIKKARARKMTILEKKTDKKVKELISHKAGKSSPSSAASKAEDKQKPLEELEQLLHRIIQRVNINLRELNVDIRPYVEELIPLAQLNKFYAFYGLTPNHPLDFQFRHSSLAGSYFLGKCHTANAILYKSDIRGDELKKKGDVYWYQQFEIPITKDEGIRIEDSFLIKTLVHSFSHDPETLEDFPITNSIASHYANIHGSPMDGSFLGPFATVDKTTMNDCVVGAFSYIQASEINHLEIDPGTIWIRSPGDFNFLYQHPRKALRQYIQFEPGKQPQGLFIDFVEDRKVDFERIFNRVKNDASVPVPSSASLDRFAVVKPKTHIGENVLVTQRAFIQNSWLGVGSNAQENCYIINSRLEGYNVTAHGAKIIETDLGRNVFVGFNAFLQGGPDRRLTIGKENIILPHTIIHTEEPLTIPEGHLVWGLIRNRADLEANSIPIERLSAVRGSYTQGRMAFEGNGAGLVAEMRNRILHILQDNGAFYNGHNAKGHAQKNQNISFNIIQPYPEGKRKGLYPTILIQQGEQRP